MAYTNQPHKCACFDDFGVGGFCYKNFGCPNKPKKAKRRLVINKNTKAETATRVEVLPSTIQVNGTRVVVDSSDIRTWVNPSIKQEG